MRERKVESCMWCTEIRGELIIHVSNKQVMMVISNENKFYGALTRLRIIV